MKTLNIGNSLCIFTGYLANTDFVFCKLPDFVYAFVHLETPFRISFPKGVLYLKFEFQKKPVKIMVLRFCKRHEIEGCAKSRHQRQLSPHPPKMRTLPNFSNGIKHLTIIYRDKV